tara:strand:+ start:189 stop:608 length:420 start_codon:yes stop_codon:yes gene_type:complete
MQIGWFSIQPKIRRSDKMIQPISKANNYGERPHSFEGDIYANGKLVRKDAVKSFRNIENANQLKATLRAGEHTFPGSYRLFFITSDGANLSFASVRENFCAILDSVKTKCADGWQVVGISGEHECEEPVFCDHSGEKIC